MPLWKWEKIQEVLRIEGRVILPPYLYLLVLQGAPTAAPPEPPAVRGRHLEQKYLFFAS